MTPAEIYALPELPKGSRALLWNFTAHLEEACLGGYESQVMDQANEDERLVLKTHFYDNFDSERSMSLASFWFDNQPVMLMQQAGRGERDYRERFITDGPRFWNMIEYLQELKNLFENIDTYTCDPAVDNQELTYFYGYQLKVVDDKLQRRAWRGAPCDAPDEAEDE